MTPTPGSTSLPFPTSGDDRPNLPTPMGSGGGDGGVAGTMRDEPMSTTASPAGGNGRGSDVLQRVVHGAHQTIDQLAERAAPAVDRLQHSGEQLGAQAGHLREVGDEWAESLRVTVREHPIAAIALAAGVGMLLARLSR